jgi:hypothetical protein
MKRQELLELIRQSDISDKKNSPATRASAGMHAYQRYCSQHSQHLRLPLAQVYRLVRGRGPFRLCRASVDTVAIPQEAFLAVLKVGSEDED